LVEHYRDHPPDYRVVVPSYQRAEACGAMTLTMLEQHDVDPDKVTVFVADDAEAETYREVLGDWRVVVAALGTGHARRFISEHYPPGTRLISFDDDVSEIQAKTPDDKLEPWTGTIDHLAALGFGLADAIDARLWGINPTANGLFLSHAATLGERFVCGIMHGSYAGDPATVGPDRSFRSSGEDYVTCLRSLDLYRNVARIEWLAPKTRYFAAGGIQGELGGKPERQADNTAALTEIAEQWPRRVRLVEKAGGVTSLRFRSTRVVAKVPRTPLEEAAGVG